MKIITGNIFHTHLPVMIHGCNSKSKMGSGVAKQVKEIYPEAFESYEEFLFKRITEYANPKTLGLINPVPVPKKPECGIRYILNAITQDNYGQEKHVRYVSYDAVDEVMSRTSIWLDAMNINQLAMPQIGAGLGNGHWPVIKEIVQHRLNHVEVTVYMWNI